MNSPQQQEPKGQPEVPTQIFAEFLSQLEKAETPMDVVERLRETILINQDLSDRAIRMALFPDEKSDD